MAGAKDNTVVAVVGGLTKTQAAKLTGAFVKAKSEIAPAGRGTIATGNKDSVGNLLQDGQNSIASIPKKGGSANASKKK